MRTIDYDKKSPGESTGNAENRIATDERMEKKFGNIQNAYNEGFAASEGISGETAETDGRVEHPENDDDSDPKRQSDSIEQENSGLADA